LKIISEHEDIFTSVRIVSVIIEIEKHCGKIGKARMKDARRVASRDYHYERRDANLL
jgi:hypothetical protein